jgi:protein-L-isoaspartate O-methyltransferase
LFNNLIRLFAGALLLATAAAAQQFGPAENLGPTISTPQMIVDRMLEAAHVKSGETVYDLGSGDGRILITAVQRFGARAVGIEIDPDQVEKARRRIHSLGLDDRITVQHASALRADLSPADVVTLYFLTSTNEKLKPNLEKCLKPGTRVVSNQFPIKGWKASEAVIVKVGLVEHTIYVYRMGQTR